MKNESHASSSFSSRQQRKRIRAPSLHHDQQCSSEKRHHSDGEEGELGHNIDDDNTTKTTGRCVVRFELDFATDTLQGMAAFQCFHSIYSPPAYFGDAPLAWRLCLLGDNDSSRDSESLSSYNSSSNTSSPPPQRAIALGLSCTNEGVHTKKERDEWSVMVVDCELVVCSQLDRIANMVISKTNNHFFAVDSLYITTIPMNVKSLLNLEEGYVRDNKMVFMAVFTIQEVTGLSTHIEKRFPFFSPTCENNDVTFVLDCGKRVRANRGYLSVCSPVFASMFQVDMSERRMHEVPLGDVTHGELIELLLVLYPSGKRVDVHNVEFILKLADRFLLDGVLKQCEKCLIDCLPDTRRPFSKRIFLIQTYPVLRDFLEEFLRSLDQYDLAVLREEVGYGMLSEKTRAVILDNAALPWHC